MTPAGDPLADLAARKDLLRRRLGAGRRARAAGETAETRAASARIQDQVMALEAVRRARVVASYAALPGEVDLDGLHDRLLGAGKRVAYPAAGQRPALTMRTATALAELTPAGKLGIREPSDGTVFPPAEIDVVLVPGVAFDRAGRRLGRGAGYYDAYLAGLGAEPARVGVAFADQLVDEVPAGPADASVDFVVTEDEVIDCGGRAIAT